MIETPHPSVFKRHLVNALNNMLLVSLGVLRELDLMISEGASQLNYSILVLWKYLYTDFLRREYNIDF